MFRLSVETLALMQHLDEVNMELHNTLNKISEAVDKDTDGAISICTGNFNNPTVIQLYDVLDTPVKTISLLKDSLPDNSELAVKWTTEDNTCYTFDMYGRPFIIVVDNVKEQDNK